MHLELQALQKALDWLAEQPEDAAELAALLSEAAPKLASMLRSPRYLALAEQPPPESLWSCYMQT